jgi:hypothetical protein
MELAGAHCGAGVEEAVCNVDGESNQRQQDGKPQGKTDACGPGKAQGPDDGDGGRVEAG